MPLSSIKSMIRASLLAFGFVAHAATITYDFNITWVTANPDGAYNRPVIGINGQWPIPVITATVGDRVIVNAVNQLGDQATSLHFHGLYMNGTTHMDGPVGVTQCGIPPGGSFKYDFPVSRVLALVIQGVVILKSSRLINPGLIGIIPTRPANIQMAYVER